MLPCVVVSWRRTKAALLHVLRVLDGGTLEDQLPGDLFRHRLGTLRVRIGDADLQQLAPVAADGRTRPPSSRQSVVRPRAFTVPSITGWRRTMLAYTAAIRWLAEMSSILTRPSAVSSPTISVMDVE